MKQKIEVELVYLLSIHLIAPDDCGKFMCGISCFIKLFGAISRHGLEVQ